MLNFKGKNQTVKRLQFQKSLTISFLGVRNFFSLRFVKNVHSHNSGHCLRVISQDQPNGDLKTRTFGVKSMTIISRFVLTNAKKKYSHVHALSRAPLLNNPIYGMGFELMRPPSRRQKVNISNPS